MPADQQFFADLFSGLVLNPQLLGRVWFASQPTSLPVGSLCIDFPRLDIVLRGEYGNLLEAKQQRMVEGEMLFIPCLLYTSIVCTSPQRWKATRQMKIKPLPI